MNKLLIFFCAIFLSPLCRAVDFQQANLWTTAIIDGHFKTNPAYFYQLGIHLRFNDNPFQLRQNVDRVRLGKHLNEHWDFILGTDYVPTLLPGNGEWVYFQSVWEQIVYKQQLNKLWKMFLWTRIDERRQLGASGMGWLNRSGIRFSGCKKDSKACPIIFFENFYYMNQPAWEDLKPWGQQRIYFAVKAVMSAKTSVNVGYLGQFLWGQQASRRFDVLSIVFVHKMD